MPRRVVAVGKERTMVVISIEGTQLTCCDSTGIQTVALRRISSRFREGKRNEKKKQEQSPSYL